MPNLRSIVGVYTSLLLEYAFLEGASKVKVIDRNLLQCQSNIIEVLKFQISFRARLSKNFITD
jgi:hypothetical protein